MDKWADNHGTRIDPLVYFDSKHLEGWMDGKFNPGSRVVLYDSVKKGAFILAIMGWMAKEIKDVRTSGGAKKKIELTLTYDDKIKLSCAGPRAPLKHYNELMMCLTTF